MGPETLVSDHFLDYCNKNNEEISMENWKTNLTKIHYLFLLKPVLSIDIFPGHFISGGDVSTLYFIRTLSGTPLHSVSYRPYRGRQHTLFHKDLIGDVSTLLIGDVSTLDFIKTLSGTSAHWIS